MSYTIKRLETVLGTMIAAATDKGVCLLEFADCQRLNRKLQSLEVTFKKSIDLDSCPILDVPEKQHNSATTHDQFCNIHLDTLEKQLAEYFKGELREFDIPLDLVGTGFQKVVWLSLPRVPYGHTISYAEQAKLIGRPTAVRAVANANGQNRVAIILPCHRVIGSDGSLTGYGGGLWRKKKLLELEKKNL